MPEQSRIHEGQLPRFETPQWFGVSVGRMAFAVLGRDSTEARTKVATDIGIEDETTLAEVPVTTIHHDDPHQTVLTDRYSDREVVRLIPFSVVEFPNDMENASPEQLAALDNSRRVTY